MLNNCTMVRLGVGSSGIRVFLQPTSLSFSHCEFTTRIRVGGIETPQLGQKMVVDNRGLPFTVMKLVRA